MACELDDRDEIEAPGHHNVARVARILCVTRMTVYNRLRKHGVVRPPVRLSPARRAPRASVLGATPPAAEP